MINPFKILIEELKENSHDKVEFVLIFITGIILITMFIVFEIQVGGQSIGEIINRNLGSLKLK